MTRFRLLLRNLLYHRRGNAAVLLGVVVGAAVLTGALLVGDSLRGSLRAQSLRRLGWVDHSLVAPRFFREKLADELAGAAERVEPAVMLQGSASTPEGARARGVTVLGVRDSFFDGAEGFGGEVVWLNGALARALGVSAGGKVTLTLTRPGDVPRESVLGRKDAGVDEWELTVGRVLGPAEPGDAFNLRPELEAPRNAYLPLRALQGRIGQPGRINALLVGGAQPSLTEALRQRLTLDDWGLTLYGPRQRAAALIARYDGRYRGKRDGRQEGREWLDGSKPRFANVIARRIQHAKPRVLERAEV